jgi:hypothetical protein
MLLDLKLVGIFINNTTFTNKPLSEVLPKDKVQYTLTKHVPKDLVADFLEPMDVGISKHIT